MQTHYCKHFKLCESKNFCSKLKTSMFAVKNTELLTKTTKLYPWPNLKAFEDNKRNKIEKLQCVLELIETLWEKEKMLETTIFSFSNNGFKRLLGVCCKKFWILVRKIMSTFGALVNNNLMPLKTFYEPFIIESWGRRLLKTFKEKEEMLVTSIFSFSLNSLPNNKILGQSNSKDIADNKIHVTHVTNFVLGRIENIVGMEKMLVTSIFSFSHNVFKMPLCQGR